MAYGTAPHQLGDSRSPAPITPDASATQSVSASTPLTAANLDAHTKSLAMQAGSMTSHSSAGSAVSVLVDTLIPETSLNKTQEVVTADASLDGMPARLVGHVDVQWSLGKRLAI